MQPAASLLLALLGLLEVIGVLVGGVLRRLLEARQVEVLEVLRRLDDAHLR